MSSQSPAAKAKSLGKGEGGLRRGVIAGQKQACIARRGTCSWTGAVIVPSGMRRLALLVAGPAALLAAVAALALSSGGRAAPAPPCGSERPRGLPGEAVELTAGEGIWSAWIAYPPVAGETITVLWRLDGFVPGELQLSGADAQGHRLAVEFGPSPVIPQLRGGGLAWPRPGREWGSRVLFSHPGCWRLEAGAGDRRGELVLWVRRS